MWGWLYLALGGFASLMTWAYAVREEATIFTTSMSVVAWAVLALTTELELPAGDGSTLVYDVGATRWLFGALALLSLVAMAGSVLGIYPESHPDTEFSSTNTNDR